MDGLTVQAKIPVSSELQDANESAHVSMWAVEGPWLPQGRLAITDGWVYPAEGSGTLYAFAADSDG